MVQLTMTPVYGKLYYDTGELRYEGYYTPVEYDYNHHEPVGRGVEYYKSGVVYREGIFGHGGLNEGKEYYPSGRIKFEGKYNRKEEDRSYYGPTYPKNGKHYLEDGKLSYEGEFKVEFCGGVGYPKIIIPEGYGPLK